jgi:hypothetical protein
VLARDPLGATGDRLVIAHGFETKMLAGLVHEGLAAAMVGEPVEASGKTVEVVQRPALFSRQATLVALAIASKIYLVATTIFGRA